LVAIAPDIAVELDALALLEHVGGLVRRGVEIGRAAEAHPVADRERLGAELVAGVGGASIELRPRPDRSAESGLDLGREGKLVARAGVGIMLEASGAWIVERARRIGGRRPAAEIPGRRRLSMESFLARPGLVRCIALDR